MSQNHHLRLNLRGEISFGPGKAELLEKIQHYGSLQEAAAAMGMSYSKAWKLVKSLNSAFRDTLVILHRGGKNQGGAEVTAAGASVVTLYRKAVAAAEKAAEPSLAKMRAMLVSD